MLLKYKKIAGEHRFIRTLKNPDLISFIAALVVVIGMRIMGTLLISSFPSFLTTQEKKKELRADRLPFNSKKYGKQELHQYSVSL